MDNGEKVHGLKCHPEIVGIWIDSYDGTKIVDNGNKMEDDGSFYFLILDTKNIHHTAEQLKEEEGEYPQCQCEWGHGYILSEGRVQLSVCEFITAGDYRINSAQDAPSGAFLYRHRVVKSQIVDHIFIDDSYVR